MNDTSAMFTTRESAPQGTFAQKSRAGRSGAEGAEASVAAAADAPPASKASAVAAANVAGQVAAGLLAAGAGLALGAALAA